MNMLMVLYAAVLFYLLSPGVLVRLPPGASPNVVLMTHAIVFALVHGLTSKMVMRAIA